MSNIRQSLADISNRTHNLVRKYRKYRDFYPYWQAQERMAHECSSEHLRRIQWKKFKEILEFAYCRIPFYKDSFKQAGVTPEIIRTREDLVRIPILSKDDVRQNFPDRFLDKDREYAHSMMGRTSGSTGESLHFVQPNETWKRAGHYNVLLRTRGIRRVPVWALYSPLCSQNTCSLHDRDGVLEMMVNKLRSSWIFRSLSRCLEAPIYITSSTNILNAPAEYMEHIVEMISYFPTCIILGDPVYLGAFARYVRKSGSPISQVSAIITGSELLTDSVRDLLREVFDCDVYDLYGASEVREIANECEYHKFHVNMDLTLVEVVSDGRPVEPGEMGKVVVTDLHNYNMPFIRYNLNDIVTAGNGKCRCGRNTDIIGAVEGRGSDVIVTNGPKLLTPRQVDQIFRGLRNVAVYRLVQKTKNSYHISIMKDEISRDFDEKVILNRCRSMFGSDAQFNIECVEEMASEPSMKYRFAYSEIPPQIL